MKRKKVFLITLMVMVCVGLFADVSKEEAKNIVFNIVGNDIEKVEIYMEENIISDNILEINNLRRLTSPYSNYWLFFIDDIPLAMWYHDCRYIMINTLDGTYTIFNEKFPIWKYKTNLEEISILEISEPTYEPYINPEPIETRDPDPNKYALIINVGDWGGGTNRFWNDMSAMYCALKENYGFMDENIFVQSLTWNEAFDDDISHDLDPNIDDIDDIDGPCFKDDIMAQCGWFAENLDPDDQLFVYVESHGLNDGNDSYVGIYDGWYQPNGLMHYNLYDTELAEWLAPINCGEMITMVMACHSGGFKDKLSDYSTYNVQCENRIIHTATDIENDAWTGTGSVTTGFLEFAYYWITAIRGKHTHCSNPWIAGYNIGEHEYLDHDFDPDNPQGGGIPEDPPNEGNNDDIIQFGEVFEYAIYMDQYCDYKGFIGYWPNREYPLVSSEIGFDDDILSMHGYGGSITQSQTVSGDFTFVTQTFIGSDVTLTMEENSNIYVNGIDLVIDNNSTIHSHGNITLSNRSLMEIQNNSNLYMHNNSVLKGTSGGVWVDPVTDERYERFELAYNDNPNIGVEDYIPGDRIIIKNNSVFSSAGDFPNFDENIIICSQGASTRWDGIEIIDCPQYYSNSLCNMNISGIKEIDIINSNIDFYNTVISDIGRLVIRDDSDVLIADNSYYTFNDKGIACFESNLTVESSFINNNNGNGIEINYLSNATILESSISYNSHSGFSLNNENIYINSSTIESNGRHGFTSFGESNNSTFVANTFTDNGWAEVVADYESFPYFHFHPEFGFNEINDEDVSNPLDQYIFMSIGGIPSASHIIGNTIIYDGDGNSDVPNPDRYYPSIDVFYFLPSTSEAMVLYNSAIDLIKEENNCDALIIMKQIISDYPDSFISKSSVNWLPYLEKKCGKNYEDLRSYINNIDLIQHPDLEKFSKRAITSTYMAEKDYTTSISRFEEVIDNSPSEVDSILAIIDGGYCYLKMLESGDRSLPEECKFKPKSFEEYSLISNNLMSQLLEEENPEEENEDSNPNNFILYSNYPNPFNSNTTISFSILNTSKIEISVFNIKGQKVKLLAKNSFERGDHSVIWNGKDDTGKSVSSGIYFYKLNVDGASHQIRKCILMK